MTTTDLLLLCQRLGPTPIPSKLRCEEYLVKWRIGWDFTPAALGRWASGMAVRGEYIVARTSAFWTGLSGCKVVEFLETESRANFGR